MKKESIIRFAQKKDLKQLIHLCELHAIFEQAEYDPKQKKNNWVLIYFQTILAFIVWL